MMTEYNFWMNCAFTKVLMMDLFQLLSSKDVNWWTGVVWITCGLLWCFYQLFGLSFWRHPFTAEDLLLRPWCYISPNLMKSGSSPHWTGRVLLTCKCGWWCVNVLPSDVADPKLFSFFFAAWYIKDLYSFRKDVCLHCSQYQAYLPWFLMT